MSKFPFKPLLLAGIAAGLPAPAAACGSQTYLGEICTFAFNFCPVGFLPADGSILSINQNTALFSLLGTYYGGDGVRTFALPDLRGRSPVGTGQAPGLSNIDIGETGGSEFVTLTSAQLPAHSHAATTTVKVTPTLNAVAGAGNDTHPAGKALAASTARDNLYSSAAPATAMAAGAVTATADAQTTIGTAGGSSTPIAIRSPYLGLNYCIATQGIFPARN